MLSRILRTHCVRLLFTCLLTATTALAGTYYVSSSTASPAGSNAAGRTGSSSQPWATLAHAASQLASEPGPHTIVLSAGTFQETNQTVLKAGWTVVGNGSSGSAKTRVQAPLAWDTSADGATNNQANYIILVRDGENVVADVTIRDIEFADVGGKKANGAIFAWKARNLLVDNVSFFNFRFAGAYIERETGVTVTNCLFENCGANVNLAGSKTGALTTLWLGDLTVSHNTFRTTYSNGYGYRGRGHNGAKIHNNTFEIHSPDFDIEIAHNNEFGVSIFDNRLRNNISIPKNGNQPDPGSTWNHSIRIHRNYSTAYEFVEGSRGWVEIDHNFVEGGTGNARRFYTDYGTNNTAGWVRIHHNVVVGNPLSFIYIERKPTDTSVQINNLEVRNNTIYFGGTSTASVLSFYNLRSDNPLMTGWKIQNNIFVGVSGYPRNFWGAGEQARLDSPVVGNNVFENINNIPAGNYSGSPGLRLAGKKPFPHYAPAGATSFAVNKGTYVGFPYVGTAPDAGAFGWRLVPWGVWLNVVARHSGKAMEVPGATLTSNTDLRQAAVSQDPQRQWRFDYIGNGEYRIYVRHSGMVAGIKSGALVDDATAVQIPWSAAAAEKWTANEVLDGDVFRIENVNSGKALFVEGSYTSDGVRIRQRPYVNSGNFQWRLQSP